MRWLAALVVSLFAMPVAFAGPAAAADIVLDTDATGSMFAHGPLGPRYTASRCIQISWTDNAASRQLGLSSAVTGKLAPYLRLQVEVGAGGGYASCKGFSGSKIYDGTLAAFGSAHPKADAQLLAGPITGRSGAMTFRLTVTMYDVNEAQGRTAAADFTFTAFDEHRAPVQPTPSPTTTAEPSPTATVVATPVEEPTQAGPASDEPPGSAAPTPGGNPPGGDPDVKKGDGAPSVTVPLTPRPEKNASPLMAPVRAVLDVVRGATRVVQQAAAPVAKGVAWSAWTLPVLLLFLVLQNNIDARDPKLAEAPVFPDKSLPFDDIYDIKPRPGQTS